jgi:predicted enzyme related to lactoylglutathione lyase
MINGFHVLMYSTNAAADRAFFRDVLGLPYVRDEGSSAEDDWLIFKLPPSELGVHPTDASADPGDVPVTTVHLMCDSIETTVEEIRAAGGDVVSAVVDRGYGLVAEIRLPGGGLIDVYEPRHKVAHSLPVAPPA